jgi:putative transposase
VIVGGTGDHVHILCNLSRTQTVAKVIGEAKRNSSKWAKTKGPDFSWQNGYGAFSVSRSQVDQVREYIAKQEEHHQEMTFQDELRTLLKKQGIAFDERYVWD